jgi:hypothetical protein
VLDLTAAVVDLGGDLPVLVPVQAGGPGPRLIATTAVRLWVNPQWRSRPRRAAGSARRVACCAHRRRHGPHFTNQGVSGAPVIAARRPVVVTCG